MMPPSSKIQYKAPAVENGNELKAHNLTPSIHFVLLVERLDQPVAA